MKLQPLEEKDLQLSGVVMVTAVGFWHNFFLSTSQHFEH